MTEPEKQAEEEMMEIVNSYYKENKLTTKEKICFLDGLLAGLARATKLVINS